MEFDIILGAISTIFLLSVNVQAENVIVTTKNGQVKGEKTLSPRGKILNRFTGIPFAEPPIGERRFQAPAPPSSWSGVLDARNKAVACPAPISEEANYTSFHYDEDCLYLSIYAPETTSSTVTLPVMVWIHGGAYYRGTGFSYDGSVLAEKNVIVVTINYRLGPLGFLTTEDSEAPGNYGMLDQIMALRWVKENIANFGGNPARVTIFGQSAGSGSVSLLLLSPLAKGLFHAAIGESGTSLSPWAVNYATDDPPPGEIARSLGAAVGCLNNNSKDLVTCLRKVPAMDLANVNLTGRIQDGRMVWAPTVENLVGFLPDTPIHLLQRGESNKVAVILGSNKDEMGFMGSGIPGIEMGLHFNLFQVLVKEFAYKRYKENRDKIAQLLVDTYVANINISDPVAVRQAYIQMVTDDFVSASIDRELVLDAKAKARMPHFAYVFSLLIGLKEYPAWAGVLHGYEIPYVFGYPWNPTHVVSPIYLSHHWTDEDKSVSENVMTMWTNFAKFGDPTPHPVDGITWHRFTSHHKPYLFIGNQSHTVMNFRHREFHLWNDVIPRFANVDNHNKPIG